MNVTREFMETYLISPWEFTRLYEKRAPIQLPPTISKIKFFALVVIGFLAILFILHYSNQANKSIKRWFQSTAPSHLRRWRSNINNIRANNPPTIPIPEAPNRNPPASISRGTQVYSPFPAERAISIDLKSPPSSSHNSISFQQSSEENEYDMV